MDIQHWNSLLKAHAPRFGAFLQSWEWGEFQKAVGRRVERVLLEKPEGFMLAQAVQLSLPLGWKYWLAAKGPVGTLPLRTMVSELRRTLHPTVFVQLEPTTESIGWKGKDRQPSTSAVIDLTQGIESILAVMKQKTRYNVRLAEKKGVTLRTAGVEAFEDFERLMEQTAVRDEFSLHPMAYYRTMLETLQGGDVHAYLAFADYDGRPLAVNLMIDFNGQRTYLHGASSNLHRNVMAPYFLQYSLIKDAVEKGMTSYDFYGIAPIGSDENHPWAGITRYKLGFGGEVVATPGTFDVATSLPVYLLYRGAKMLQKLKKR